MALVTRERAELDLLLLGLPGRWRRSSEGRVDRVYSLVRDREGLYVLSRDGEEIERTACAERVREVLIGSVGFFTGDSSHRPGQVSPLTLRAGRVIDALQSGGRRRMRRPRSLRP